MEGHIFCAWEFQYFNVGRVCFSFSLGARLIPGLDLEVLLLLGQKAPHIFKEFFKSSGICI